MKVCHKGCTRTVILVGRYAVKIPTFSSWELFLKGLFNNIQEGKYVDLNTPDLAKVLYCNTLGFICVMEKVRPVRNRGLFWVELSKLVSDSHLPSEFILYDAKPENFGYDHNNRLVKLDYGK